MLVLNWSLPLQKDLERLWLTNDLFLSFYGKPNFAPGFLMLSLSAMLPFPVAYLSLGIIFKKLLGFEISIEASERPK
jgi:hypothetical protein